MGKPADVDRSGASPGYVAMVEELDAMRKRMLELKQEHKLNDVKVANDHLYEAWRGLGSCIRSLKAT